MKVKEAERTANAAWSPAPLPDLMLAAGTAAQQLDATFSSSARLEIFGLGLGDSTLEMPVLASVETPSRFHCVSWGAHGLSTGSRPAGMIVGGSDGGKIALYDARKLLDGQPALLETTSRHTGAVRSLDFNPFQANLLASGASDSELYIWDLNSPSTPMTPGAKAQPAEDVSAVTWNRQVQHIMASTFTSRCVVWDLRKNEPIIKVGDGQAGMKCKVVAWHPEVATQLVLASEDDHTPAIQLWDLRFATAPLKTLQRHQKGILSLAWCQRDSHLLLSAGKDDKILCWDPHSDAPGGEVVAELSASPQWNFSVEWCPRNPALIAASSFDGHVSVYNVMGKVEEPLASPTSALADSFPDMAGVAAALPTVQRRTSIPLTRPPRWMKRPCGATFGFGGRLVSFCHTPTTDGGRPTRQVEIHQVVTEPELVQRSQAFQQVLMTDGLPGFCTERAESAAEPDRPVWRFLAARFSSDPRGELLRLLGYQSRPENGGEGENGADDQAMQEPPAAESGEDAFEAISRSQTSTSDSPTAEPEELFDIPAGDDTDGQVSQAILRGDMTEAVERCLQSERTADALIIAMATSQELYESTRAKYLESMKTDLSRLISALVSRDWSTVVGRCDPGSWREALVAVLTHAPPEQVAPLC
ncbi:protein transport protein Sec31A-like, partial [Amphibalanus amphitrite]|uniref:protein transport protein Sec31A-like n=2 Tax=Amphibalanus amphitrite TaxID=1232801 RepID=UPI001C916325